MQTPYLVGCLRYAGLPPYPQNWVLPCSPRFWAPPLPQKVKPSFTPLICSVADGIHEMMNVHMQCTCYTCIIEHTCPHSKPRPKTCSVMKSKQFLLDLIYGMHILLLVFFHYTQIGQRDFQWVQICLYNLCFAFSEFSHPVSPAPSPKCQLACPIPLIKASQSLLQALLLIIQHLVLCCFW